MRQLVVGYLRGLTVAAGAEAAGSCGGAAALAD